MPDPVAKPISQSALAQLAGVHRVTVTKALAGDQSVAAQTREKIAQLARKHGYRPNTASRAMSSGQFGAIALLLGTRDGRSSLPEGLLNGIHDALEARDLALNVARLTDQQLAQPGQAPKLLRETSSDGLLIDYTHDIPDRAIRMISRSNAPAIWINTKRADRCVHPDDIAAGRMAAELLLRRGHTRIAYADFTHGPDFDDPHYSAADRLTGAREAVEAAGLQLTIWTAAEGADVKSPERIGFAAVRLQADQPTAVISYSSTAAVPIYIAATSRGLDMPTDLSLVSFDNNALGYLGPLTSLIVPHDRVGRAAVDELTQLIANPDQPRPCVAVPFDLEPGATLARAKLLP
jgi:LacI family transcriptional regulator